MTVWIHSAEGIFCIPVNTSVQWLLCVCIQMVSNPNLFLLFCLAFDKFRNLVSRASGRDPFRADTGITFVYVVVHLLAQWASLISVQHTRFT